MRGGDDERDDRIDLDALLDAVRRVDAPLVYLANPDNPMGTWHDAADLRAFIDALPESTLLVLDEAYIEPFRLDVEAGAARIHPSRKAEADAGTWRRGR